MIINKIKILQVKSDSGKYLCKKKEQISTTIIATLK